MVDEKGIELFKKYMGAGSGNDYFFKMDRTNFSRHLKTITQKALEEKITYIYNAKAEDDVMCVIANVISTHSISRYAIQKNTEKYEIEVAKAFSGHTNYRTIEKHPK